jgi:hypothetical protein
MNKTPSSINDFINHPWLISHKKFLSLVFPGKRDAIKLVDLGCFNGAYTVEFAKMGFNSLGIEVREKNFRDCLAKQKTHSLPNLSFIKDTVWNVEKYGDFDISFCSGILYHLDKPSLFLDKISKITKKVLIVQTHFSLSHQSQENYSLSKITTNEGLPGRWYQETDPFNEKAVWASWENSASFWIQREYLIQKIKDCGFDLVFEQFDGYLPGPYENHSQGKLGDDLSSSYNRFLRSSFIGVRE